MSRSRKADAGTVTREPAYGGELCVQRDGRGQVLKAWLEAAGKADERRLICDPRARRGTLIHDPLYGGESYEEGRAQLYLPDIIISARVLPYEAWVDEAIGYVRRLALVDAAEGLRATAVRVRDKAGARELAARATELLCEKELPSLHRASVELCLAVAASRGADLDPRPHLDACVARFPRLRRGEIPLGGVKKLVGARWWHAHVTQPVLQQIGARLEEHGAAEELTTALQTAVDLLGESALTKAAPAWAKRILGWSAPATLRAESLYALLRALPRAFAKLLSLVNDEELEIVRALGRHPWHLDTREARRAAALAVAARLQQSLKRAEVAAAQAWGSVFLAAAEDVSATGAWGLRQALAALQAADPATAMNQTELARSTEPPVEARAEKQERSSHTHFAELLPGLIERFDREGLLLRSVPIDEGANELPARVLCRATAGERELCVYRYSDRDEEILCATSAAGELEARVHADRDVARGHLGAEYFLAAASSHFGWAELEALVAARRLTPSDKTACERVLRGQWRAIAPSPLEQVREQRAVSLPGGGLVVAPARWDARSNAVAYDLARDRWRALTLAPWWQGELLALPDGRILSVRGRTAALFDLADRWERLAELPFSVEIDRVGALASLADGRVLAYGGMKLDPQSDRHDTPSSEAALLSLATRHWESIAPAPTCCSGGLAVTLRDGSVLVQGHRDKTRHTDLDLCFSEQRGFWRAAPLERERYLSPTLLVPLSDGGALSVADRASAANPQTRKAWRWHPAVGLWQEAAAWPARRNGAGVVLGPDLFAIVGGVDVTSKQPVAEFTLIAPALAEWNVSGPALPFAADDVVAARVGERHVLVLAAQGRGALFCD